MNQPHQPEKNFLPGILKTIKGSSSTPHSGGNSIILCFADINGTLENDTVKPASKRWLKISNDFRRWYREQTTFKLGNILPISVQSDIEVLLLLVLDNNVLDLEALKDALISANRYTVVDKKNIHINKTNEQWKQIEQMLNDFFIKNGINVNVYENN